jgi:hypothetical protein
MGWWRRCRWRKVEVLMMFVVAVREILGKELRETNDKRAGNWL